MKTLSYGFKYGYVSGTRCPVLCLDLFFFICALSSHKNT
jgi:hypothetical protein